MAETWTVGRILSWMEGFLGEHGDENPRLSAQWLVSDALGVSRIQLYADLARPLTLEERDVLRAYTKPFSTSREPPTSASSRSTCVRACSSRVPKPKCS